jgi:hypothetical protein
MILFNFLNYQFVHPKKKRTCAERAERGLNYWNNEYIMSLISDNANTIFPCKRIIYNKLIQKTYLTYQVENPKKAYLL